MSGRIRSSFSIPVLFFVFFTIILFSLAPATHAQDEVGGGTLPDISVIAGSSAPSVRNGERITFTVEVENNGNVIGTNIVVTEFLPLPYVHLLSCLTSAPAGCTPGAASQIITFPTLNVGERQVISLVTEARSTYMHSVNTVQRVFVASTGADSNTLNNKSRSSIQLFYPVDLALSQQLSSSAELLPGTPLTMSLAVRNIDSNSLFRLQTQSFTNSEPITMPDAPALFTLQPALTYPSLITVEGVNHPVVKVDVSIFGISRTWTEDVDMLLVGPSGVSVTLLSDVGGATALGGIDLIFSDNATRDATSQDTIPAGEYRPTNFARKDEPWEDVYPDPGPGTVYNPVPYLGSFNGLDPNGVWRLYILDDQPRDDGVIRFGWGITFTELITQQVPIQIQHSAPSVEIVNDVSAPDWVVTKTTDGFVAVTIVDGITDPSPIELHAVSPITPGFFPMTSEVLAHFGEVNLENNRVITSLVNTSLSDLAITGTVTPIGALYGETVTYTLVAVNNGPTTALDSILLVQVADELNVTKATSSMGACTISGAKVTCNSGILRSLESSDIMTVTLIADTPAGGVPGPVPVVTTAVIEAASDPIAENNQIVLNSTVAEFARESVYLPLIAR